MPRVVPGSSYHASTVIGFTAVLVTTCFCAVADAKPAAAFDGFIIVATMMNGMFVSLPPRPTREALVTAGWDGLIRQGPLHKATKARVRGSRHRRPHGKWGGVEAPGRLQWKKVSSS